MGPAYSSALIAEPNYLICFVCTQDSYNQQSTNFGLELFSPVTIEDEKEERYQVTG